MNARHNFGISFRVACRWKGPAHTTEENHERCSTIRNFNARSTPMLTIFQRLKKAIKRTFRLRTLPGKKILSGFLSGARLTHVDVGGTRGAAGLWEDASHFTDVILFDPDPRASISEDDPATTVYPVGLWSAKARKTLYLAANPDASSLFEFNRCVLRDFANAPMHEVVASESISVDTMASVMAGRTADFIKLDTEGADLEILKGAEDCFRKSCVGVFIEVSFVERHKGAPNFGGIDAYMRSAGFMLMDLFPEHWLRLNGVLTAFSRPQLIWGNALYVLRRKVFLERLQALEPFARQTAVAKFVTILLLYGLHDYAQEIVEHALEQQLITTERGAEARAVIRKAMALSRVNICRVLAGLLISGAAVLVCCPLRSSRQLAILFFKVQLSELCTMLLQFARCRLPGTLVHPADPTVRL